MITIDHRQAQAVASAPSPTAAATAVLVRIAENRAKRIPVGRHRAVTR